ncbi:hypothetical protein YB2330_003137 [Saitoella coloradoensis]
MSNETIMNGDQERPLPAEVISCLKNARYLHLGTSYEDIPHVSLMNYTYVPAGEALPYETNDCVIMTSTRDTKKFFNLHFNPRVSLLVHDWTTTRQSLTGPSSPGSTSDAHSSLASLLLNLNAAALSSISATLNGRAEILTNTAAADFFKQKHSAANPGSGSQCYIEGDVAVIKVRIESARIVADGGGDRVEKWRVDGMEGTPRVNVTEEAASAAGRGSSMGHNVRATEDGV